MVYWYALLSAVVQGLTEFIPVSSSGHLLLIHSWFNFTLDSNVAFDVSLHLGTALALIIYFWSDLIIYIRAFFQSLKRWNLQTDLNQRLAWYLLIATIPGALLGALFESKIETVLRSPVLVAVMMVLVGVLFLIVEKWAKHERQLASLTWREAVVIGLAQALALIPGTSRSGITIITGMTLKLQRDQAARFSFLMSVPIILGAGVKKAWDVVHMSISTTEINSMLLGFVVSAIVGYFCVKYLLRYLQGHRLNVFAYYRFGLALVIVLIWWVGR